MRFCLAYALVLSTVSLAPAATHIVDPTGSGDFLNVQAALDAAENGDVIQLVDAVFIGDGNRDIDFLGKSVTVESQSKNAEACIIDCGASTGDPHRGFLFVTDEGRDSVLRALTIQNGFLDAGNGAGVLCQGASPTFERVVFQNNQVPTNGNGGGMATDEFPILTECVFRENQSTDFLGGGLFLDQGSAAVVIGCLFDNNQASSGGAIGCNTDADPEILECTFLSNDADFGGAVFCFVAAPIMQNCLFVENFAVVSGGALITGGAAQIRRCTFSRNVAGNWGGAAYAWESSSSVFTNCTFTANRAFEGSGSYCSATTTATFENCLVAFGELGEAAACESGSSTIMTCCNLFGNQGGDWVACVELQGGMDGNMSLDPQFCSSMPDEQQSWTLQSDSPCAPVPSGCDLIGAWDVACATTASRTQSWGGLKARFDPH